MSLEPETIATWPGVEATLNYLAPSPERPRSYADDPPAGVPRTNVVTEAHAVVIHDLRRAPTAASLDGEGFATADYPSAVRDFLDEDEVRKSYFAEAEAFLKQATGADRVFVFDATVRRRIAGAEDRRGARQPGLRVHVDQTTRSGPERVREFLPDDAEALLRGRVQIVNIWRPIRTPLLDHPLAVADARSIDPEDLVPSDLIYHHRVGENYNVLHNPRHRWFYLSAMRHDEVLLLKCYDSATDGRARFAPHSAFVDPTTPADAPLRESIELRTLVFQGA